MKVESIYTTRIKPSSPTPSRLRLLDLSLRGRLHPPSLYCTLLLFYTSSRTSTAADDKLRVLFRSLSEALVLFYPLAGRLRPDGVSVDCNDEGAFVVASRTDSRLEDLLLRPDPSLLEQLVPVRDEETMKSAKGSVLLLQFTTFGCGGIVVSICPSHELMDATSICSFVRTWSTIATRNVHERFSHSGKLPEFIGASLLPPDRTQPSMLLSSTNVSRPVSRLEGKTRRFIFTRSKVAELKARFSLLPEIGERTPTSVEAIQALMLKCAIRAASTHLSSRRTSVVFQTINLRKRMDPHLPDNAIGNQSCTLPTSLGDGPNVELCEVVMKIRKAVDEFYERKERRFEEEEGGAAITAKQDMPNVYGIMSLCRLPFYEMDFGWGRPVAWFVGPSSCNNLFVLKDGKSGDGVEAWMTLDAKEMDLLMRDGEFLSYASLQHPNVCSSRL